MKIFNLNPTSFSRITAGLLATALLSACGGMKQDPTGEYSDLKKDLVKPHFTPARTQEAASNRPFQITPAVDGQIWNFVEGEKARFEIQARAIEGTVFSVLLKNPVDESMKLVATDKPGVLALEWTAPKGFLAENQLDRMLALEFELVVLPESSPQARARFFGAEPVDRSVQIPARVVRSSEQAVITQIRGLKERVNQGERLELSIEVRDLSAHAGRLPDLMIGDDNDIKAELYESYGAVFIRPHLHKPSVEMKADGSFVFHRVLDTNIADIPRKLKPDGSIDTQASEVVLRMNFFVIGANGLRSGVEARRVRVVLREPAPAAASNSTTNSRSKPQTPKNQTAGSKNSTGNSQATNQATAQANAEATP